ncbi:MAG: aminopeptidase P family N-terminal domain-containing protein, partial [Gemmatimonadales bacterium]
MRADRRGERLQALAPALATAGVGALLVTSRPNVRYLTGFSGSAALVVVTPRDVLLVTDFRYEEQARAEAGAIARVVVERASAWDRLFQELPGLGRLETIGYEAHALTVLDAGRF